MTELRKTPLHALHRESGAKLVDFAGWEMPLHYGSQVGEHHQVRRSAGMFDVSHMLAVDLRGSGVRGFLRALLANDVARLTQAGKALYSCMLNPDGGVIDDLICCFFAENRFRLIVNAATADKDTAWIEAQRGRLAPQVELVPRCDVAIIAVQGPQAREKVWRALPGARAATEPLMPFQAAEVGDMVVARTGYTGEDGFEIMLPAEHATSLWKALQAQEVTPAGLGARDTLRLEAGMNLYGQDMDENVTPLESGLAWTVDLKTTREFIGRAGLLDRPPVRQLFGLVLMDRGVMRRHQQVRCAGGEGEITSGGFSPTLDRSIAFARVPLAVGPEHIVEVGIRDKWLRAKAVKPPFVRQGRILVNT